MARKISQFNRVFRGETGESWASFSDEWFRLLDDKGNLDFSHAKRPLGLEPVRPEDLTDNESACFEALADLFDDDYLMPVFASHDQLFARVPGPSGVTVQICDGKQLVCRRRSIPLDARLTFTANPAVIRMIGLAQDFVPPSHG